MSRVFTNGPLTGVDEEAQVHWAGDVSDDLLEAGARPRVIDDDEPGGHAGDERVLPRLAAKLHLLTLVTSVTHVTSLQVPRFPPEFLLSYIRYIHCTRYAPLHPLHLPRLAAELLLCFLLEEEQPAREGECDALDHLHEL